MAKTIQLKHPATLGERTITEITLQRPKYRHFLAVDTHPLNSIASDIALIASLSGEAETLIQELDVEDIAALREALVPAWTSFFDSSKPYDENPPKPEPAKP
jgi:hypothetical protein